MARRPDGRDGPGRRARRSSPSAGTSSRAGAATRRSATTCSGSSRAPRRPRVCLLPTASGDPADQIAAFRSSLGGRGCELSHVSLFRLEAEAVDLAAHLLAQDLIYVGGGSMLNLLAIWRAHGIDEILRRVLASAAWSSPARARARCAGSSGG